MLILHSFFLYETKGLTLEQIDEMYGVEGLKPWQSSNWQPTDKEILHQQKRDIFDETNQYKSEQAGVGIADHVEQSRRGAGNEENVPGFQRML